MLNYIWLGLVLAAVALGAIQGNLADVTTGAFDAAKSAVMNIALPLAGLMAFWLGLMRLAEKSGIVAVIARALRPLMSWLFPDVPKDHPAIGAIVMNMAANMLGLANAATPLGLRAMQLLEKLNPHPGTATNAMCTFLAINTSSVQLIPATAVALLAAAGSTRPFDIVGTALVATICSTAAGITAVKLLERLPMYQLPTLPEGAVPIAVAAHDAADDDGEPEPTASKPLGPVGWVIMVIFLGFIGWASISLYQKEVLAAGGGGLRAVVGTLSVLAIPLMLAFFPLYAALKRVPVYEEFVEGAKDGFQTAIRIIPFLVAILAAIGMFRAANGITLLSQWLSPVLSVIGLPVELLPLVLMRPLSGSGTTAIYSDIISQPGAADSFTALLGGTIMGSTETTFYVIAVYFGSVAIRRTRHAVPAGLIADFVGVSASIAICNIMFR
ncbi:MAG: nucleoside recognition domain-containing protein [Chthoniobacterales bacterium]